MKKTSFARVAIAANLALVLGAGSALAAANCIKGEHKPPYKIGWANIYSIPTWMKETTGTIEDMANQLKKEGLVESLTITDAQGNANTQIQQIQSMIDAKLDAIIVDAGSATALDRVIADACAKGIAVANFDSLVDTNDLTTKIDTDQIEWGKLAAEWLVKQLNGKGNILVLNGPAGVSVSDDRRKGAEPVFKANPGIKILAETNTAYNAAPAQEAVTNLLFSNPQIDGIWSQGGALSAGAVTAFEKQGRKLVPMTGENYRPFLEMWKAEEAHRLGNAAAELAGCACRLCGGPGAAGQGHPGLYQRAAADHRRQQSRQLSCASEGLRRRRLHLLAIRHEAVRRAHRQEPEEIASRRAGLERGAAADMGVQQAVLGARNVSKAFFGNPVLRDVSIELVAGRIHALLGENGAGKSTLINLLSGTLAPDSGEIRIDGQPIAALTPREAHRHGVAVVQQELSLAPHLSIAENIGLGAYDRRSGLIDYGRLAASVEEIGQKLGLVESPDTPVGQLPLGRRQIVEIAKALFINPRVLILDEPTSSLAAPDVATLMKLIRSLRDEGVAILYISHRLNEILDFCDYVTVLKDGAVTADRPLAGLDPEGLVRLMVGRDPQNLFPPYVSHASGDLVLQTRNSARRRRTASISSCVAARSSGLAASSGTGRKTS